MLIPLVLLACVAGAVFALNWVGPALARAHAAAGVAAVRRTVALAVVLQLAMIFAGLLAFTSSSEPVTNRIREAWMWTAILGVGALVAGGAPAVAVSHSAASTPSDIPRAASRGWLTGLGIMLVLGLPALGGAGVYAIVVLPVVILVAGISWPVGVAVSLLLLSATRGRTARDVARAASVSITWGALLSGCLLVGVGTGVRGAFIGLLGLAGGPWIAARLTTLLFGGDRGMAVRLALGAIAGFVAFIGVGFAAGKSAAVASMLVKGSREAVAYSAAWLLFPAAGAFVVARRGPADANRDGTGPGAS